ncbi:hypothetical protein L226DRAFT_539571 [Lentinus tigrinus ALCF2SS1-7]|uniref:uncharacterized protein n=1 Tax=Lentinus tigrinus ALCF2SS1-7 TaxID=1328758 RepID=UPI0011663F47|nr:hypothetical protein L226DRAFT_539571 [Lentinus tigrinus ALCF2SS1-7]
MVQPCLPVYACSGEWAERVSPSLENWSDRGMVDARRPVPFTGKQRLPTPQYSVRRTPPIALYAPRSPAIPDYVDVDNSD